MTLPKFKSKHHIDDIFDLFISSAIEGIKKPDAEIFLLTAQRLGVKPEECLFMDDSKSNIDGVKKAGMKSIWWKDRQAGFNDFIKFLKTNG